MSRPDLGITAEQRYQEDLLEAAYAESDNPDFQRRAEVMRKTWENSDPNPNEYEGNQTTVFEA